MTINTPVGYACVQPYLGWGQTATYPSTTKRTVTTTTEYDEAGRVTKTITVEETVTTNSQPYTVYNTDVVCASTFT